MSSAEELARLRTEYTHLLMLAVAASTYLAQAMIHPELPPKDMRRKAKAGGAVIPYDKLPADVILDIHATAKRSGFRP
ncbi:hypothetical protein GCM10019059_34690 [Camelimonas fluminis]|uniref:Uncharacterized protein n=1 Tax=Camelimonas fluminis TaxID=1576911 RepID=A0ABV7UHP3_9HYPH|nr:hypothetical protein [Camelimonas fluminis]GHE72152.1 hypothetical protein GCM10019059_34690 [Camelimonas fluminis]